VTKSDKSFFYPVLREGLSDYADGSVFKIDLANSRIVDEANEQKFCFDGKVSLSNMNLMKLVNDGQAKLVLVVYCSATMLRLTLEISKVGVLESFEIPANQLIGNVDFQPLVVLKSKEIDFKPSGANTEYGVATFKLKRGAFLAIGDALRVSFTTERLDKRSFFRVQQSNDLDPNVYEFVTAPQQITILMGSNAWKAWNLLTSDSEEKPYLFMSIYKDLLQEAVQSAINSPGEFVWAEKLMDLMQDHGISPQGNPSPLDIHKAVLKLIGRDGIERIIADEL
jgi:hypothetical protein